MTDAHNGIIVHPMSTQRIPDIDQMAKHFADLWNDQWRQIMTHPDTASNLMKFADMMGPSQQMAQQMMSRFFTPETQGASRQKNFGFPQPFAQPFAQQAAPQPAPQPTSQPAPAAPAAPSVGPEAFAAAFGALSRQLDEFAGCLISLSRRVDALEKPKRAKPRAKPVAKPAAKPARASVKRAQPSGRAKAQPARKGR